MFPPPLFEPLYLPAVLGRLLLITYVERALSFPTREKLVPISNFTVVFHRRPRSGPPPSAPSFGPPADAGTDDVSIAAAAAARETAAATAAADVATARAAVLKSNAESARLRLRSFLPAQREALQNEEEDIDLGDLSDLDLGSEESDEDDELIQELVAADNRRKVACSHCGPSPSACA